MREQRQRLVLLAHKAYGDGRLGMNSVGEWFWIQQDGGRVYLGWSATGAARRLNAVISANQRRSMSSRL
jgi:hypothetical protein